VPVKRVPLGAAPWSAAWVAHAGWVPATVLAAGAGALACEGAARASEPEASASEAAATVAIRARLTRELLLVLMTTPRMKVRQRNGSEECVRMPPGDVYTGTELHRKGPPGVVFHLATTRSEYRLHLPVPPR
jgi:hypothetical protein